MEDEKKKLEEQITSLIDEFNRKHNIKIDSINLDYWDYRSLGTIIIYPSVKIEVQTLLR